MRSETIKYRHLLIMMGAILLPVLAFACRSDEEATVAITEVSTLPPLTSTPSSTPIIALQPVATDTQEPATATAAQPTVTSPVPTRTPMPTVTPSPTPPPEPTFHVIESGDTLFGIAESYGVTIDALTFANGFASPSEFSLIVGQELQIPLCEIHEVVSGNTLAGIALACGISLDNLVSTNIAELAKLGSLDAIPLGFILIIPPESSVPDDLDCATLPPRVQVIEYSPGLGEGLFCLSQRYGVSTTTLLRANLERLSGRALYGDLPLLIPPVEGALYSLTAEDISNGVVVADLADWYEVEAESITDWNGNIVSGPLMEGQQLLVAGANLTAGPFRFQIPE